MDVLLRVVPVFAVILAGVAGRRFGLLPPSFQDPANRLAFYVAIPSLVFLAVAGAPLREVFRPAWIGAALAAVLACWAGALALAGLLGLRAGSRATFAQAAVHANLSYIGLAICFYGLGARGLQVAGVFAPFLMLANNALAVLGLGRHGGGGRRDPATILRAVALNPVILASLAGLAWSWSRFPLPPLAAETLRILGSTGLPLALLLIGAGLGLEALRRPVPVAAAVAVKNLLLPALGALALTALGAGGVERAVAVLLLGSPSATLTLVMAREMAGDAPLASAAVTASTLASAATLTLWLALLGGG